MTDFTVFKKGLRDTRDAFNSGYAKDTRVSMPGSDWAALFNGIAILVEEVETMRNHQVTLDLIVRDNAKKNTKAIKQRAQILEILGKLTADD